MGRPSKHSPLRERAVRMVFEHVGVFRPGGARPPSEVMVTFVDQHRKTYGVEPICAVLPITPSTYFRHKKQQRAPR